MAIEYSLENVYTHFQQYYYIEDTRLIDTVLAVKRNLKLKDVPLWLLLVGRSGTGKTTLLKTLETKVDTAVIQKLTARALVTGKGSLKDNANKYWGKLVLIFDLARTLSLNPIEKQEIFAQWCDWYDGRLGGTYGTGKDVDYQGKPPQMLIASTPSIYNEQIIHNQLGTRELVYYVDIKNKDEFRRKSMELSKSGLVQEATNHCKLVVQQFLDGLPEPHDNPDIPEQVEKKIIHLTDKLSVLRATAAWDRYSGELLSDAHYEIPSRNSQQLQQFYLSLKSLDSNYSDQRALEILEHIVESSGDPVTTSVYRCLNDADMPLTTNEVSKRLKLGFKTVNSRLNLLWNIGVIEMEVNTTQGGRAKFWDISSEYLEKL
jgi:energy-coupling factor transporter ATP-binding protein EcfA2